MIDQNPTITTVADAAIFVHCTPKQAKRLEALSSIIEVKAGYELTKEGRLGLEFGVIIDGIATVSVAGNDVATLGAGDHYGEVALLKRLEDPDRAVRIATVTASTDMRVAVMTVQEFATVLADLPEVAEAVRRAAQERCALTDAA